MNPRMDSGFVETSSGTSNEEFDFDGALGGLQLLGIMDELLCLEVCTMLPIT